MRFNKKVLILTPTKLPSITGNAINTERWRRLLLMAGAHVDIVPTEKTMASQIVEKIKSLRPHIIHCHHALKTGSLFLNNEISEVRGNIPLVVSLPGTDINIGIQSQRDIILSVLNQASAILCQSKVIEEIAKREFPHLKDRIFYIPRSIVWFGEKDFDIRKIARCKQEDTIFFHPAGIRPVKGNLECLEFFEDLNKLRKNIKILFAGPTLDEKYSRDFMEKLKDCSDFATWVPSITTEAMKSAYRGADIVINTSFSEGISTVLLEAIHLSKPILASDIPANRWLLAQNGTIDQCGFLYDLSSKEDFIKKALLLIDSSQIRERLSWSTKERIKVMPKPEDELISLVHAYIKGLSY